MESKYRIRKVQKEDLTHIFQLEEEVFKPNHYPLFVLRQFYDILSDLFFVAVDENYQIIGYCFGGVDHTNKIGWVFALAVTKAVQKKKIGERITNKLLEAFKNRDVSTIQLTTTPDNTAAIKLYEKLGFEKVTETKDYYFDDSPRILMQLNMK